MSIEVGTKLGRYEIRSKIGEGGMGEVYVALDTKLNRTVAIKVLQSEVAADHKRMHRFVQEAQAASALNHPNILTIYEIEDTATPPYIAMEFIDGETVRARLMRKPLRISDAVDLAIQVASALAAAHDAGIVHRDIKPDNIMLRRDGYVKVLDFGLAKLTAASVTPPSGAEAEAPTRAMVKTDPGAVMGTVNYMSPEQASGKEVDQRTDIWSLGVVLYEMITHRVPFSGATPSHTIVSILEKEPPPLSAYDSTISDTLDLIVTQALAKDRDERWQSAKQMLAALKKVKQRLDSEAQLDRSTAPEALTHPGGAAAAGSSISGSTSGVTTSTTAAASTASLSSGSQLNVSSAEYVVNQIKSHKTGVTLGAVVALIAVIGIGFGVYKFLNQPKSSAPSKVMKITRLTTGGRIGSAAITGGASISPDGKYVAFLAEENGKTSIWVQQVSTGTLHEVLPGVEGVDYGPTAFSRDGEFIYYVQYDERNPKGVLYQMSVLGSTRRKVLADIQSPAVFSPDGKHIAFIRANNQLYESMLMIADADGSNERKLASRKEPDSFTTEGPSWSPDGKRIALGINHAFSSGSVIEIALDSGTEKSLTSQNWVKVFRVVWLNDASGLLVTAFAEQAATGTQLWFLSYPDGLVRPITNDLGGYGTVSLGVTGDNSTLVTVQEDFSTQIWTVGANEDPSQAKRLTTGKYDGYGGLTLSPDGKIVYSTKTGDNVDLWMMNADGSGNKPLTSDAYIDVWPTVSPDGRYIVFGSSRGGNANIWRMDSDGSNPKPLTSGTDFDLRPVFSLDGQSVIFESTRSGKQTLWRVSIDGGQPVQITDYRSQAPAVSPDGKLIACFSFDEANKPLLVLLPIEGGPPVKRFGVPYGTASYLTPKWMADGRALSYAVFLPNNFALWNQPVDGSKPTRVLNVMDQRLHDFVWARNGKEIIASYGTQPDDVVLMKDFR